MSNVSYHDRAQAATPRVWQEERTALPIRGPNPLPALVFSAVLGVGLATAYYLHGLSVHPESGWIVAIAAALALLASSSIKVADQWDRAVV